MRDRSALTPRMLGAATRSAHGSFHKPCSPYRRQRFAVLLAGVALRRLIEKVLASHSRLQKTPLVFFASCEAG